MNGRQFITTAARKPKQMKLNGDMINENEKRKTKKN